MSTINAASCSRDDVLAAFAAATAFSLTSTDPILVKWPATPAGGLAWKEPILWNAPPNVTLMGAGKDKTILIDEYQSGDPLIQIAPHAEGYFHWFHMRFKGGNVGSENNTKWGGLISISGQCKNFWMEEVPIDVQSYTPLVPTAAIRFTGHINGVCVPGLVRGHSSGGQIQVWYNGYGGANDVGDASFAAPTGFGGPDFLFIEDTLFETNSAFGGFATDSMQGGKYVIRHCAGLHTVQTHSTSSGNGRGSRAIEVYRNKFKGMPDRPSYCAVWLDCGTGMVWGNDAEDTVHFQVQPARRRSDDGHGQNATPVGYGYCGPAPQSGVVNVNGSKVTWVSGAKFNPTWPARTMMFIGPDANSNGYIIGSVASDTELTLAPGGTNPNLPGTLTNAVYSMGSHWDGNEDPITGYPMMDQVGRGKGDLLTGWFPNLKNGATGADASSPGAWPRQALEPMYQFANKHVPVPSSGGVMLAVADVMKEDRDYYREVPNFDGTKGVGVGLLAERPTTCVPGVGYWETDKEELYVCKTPNVWEFYYKPYPHPHPLRAGGVPPIGTDPTIPPVEPPVPPVEPPVPPTQPPSPPNGPPAVKITAPADGAVITVKTQLITVAATDDTGVSWIQLWINDQKVKEAATTTLSYSWNTSPYKGKGPVTIKVIARDAEGLVTEDSRVVTVKK